MNLFLVDFKTIIISILLITIHSCSNKHEVLKVDIPVDCKSDSLQRFHFHCYSDLSFSDSIRLCCYKKNNLFNILLENKKVKIRSKIFYKEFNRWAFDIGDSLNVNNDYLLVIPDDIDSSFYYLSKMELFYVTNLDSTDYDCRLESYEVNGVARHLRQIILEYPLKVSSGVGPN